MHKGRVYAIHGQVYLLCGHGIGVSTHPGACIERDSKRSLTPSPTSPGAEAAPPTARGTAEGQRCTHAVRMRSEAPRAPTGAGIAAGVEKDTHSPTDRPGGQEDTAHAHALHRGAEAAHAAGGGAGLPSHPHALTAPPDAPQATTGGTVCGASTHRTPCPQRAHRFPTERGAGRGEQLPTHRTKTSHSRTG